MRSVNVLIDFTGNVFFTIINADEKSVEEVIQLERKVIRSARCNKAVEKYDNHQHWRGTSMVFICIPLLLLAIFTNILKKTLN